MRPASTFILSSANPHALAGFPDELKPCVDEALQDPKIFRKILTNKKIATNPQFFNMITAKMGREHPALLFDALTQPVVMESLEEIDPKLAKRIALVSSKLAVDENIEAIYENASANLLKLASRQDPEALLDFATDSNIFPVLAIEDNSFPNDLADIFEEEFGKLGGTLDDEDESLIRDLREMSYMVRGATLSGDTLGIWGKIKSAGKKLVNKVKTAVKRVKTAVKKVYTRAKTAVKKTYNRAKTAAKSAYNRVKTTSQNVAKNAVNRARSVAAAAVSRVKAATVAAKHRIVAARQKIATIAKSKLEAAKKVARDIGARIKASKDAAIAKAKKLYSGIKAGVNTTVTKAKNLVGKAAKKYNELKNAAIQKALDYKKKVADFKAAAMQKVNERIIKTKEYLAKKAQAALEKAKKLKDWGKKKLSGAMAGAGKLMRSGANILKTGKDVMVNAGKKALNWGIAGAKKAGGALLGAGKTIGKVLASPFTAAYKMGYMGAEALSNYLANRAEGQEETEEDPGELYDEPMGPEEMMDMSGMYDPAGAGMEAYAEEPYMEEEPYPEEELPPGMECMDGEEMPEEQMVCSAGKWVCKEGAEIDVGEGAAMVCRSGEWVMPEAGIGEELPSGAEAGLPEGHVCNIGDREEIVPDVFMECVDGQWKMPEEPGYEPGVPGYEPGVPGMMPEDEYMPPEEEAPPEYMPHVPGEEWLPSEEGGYVAPESEDMMELPEDIREEIAEEIQDVTMPLAEEWSEEGPVPGTVVPMPETGLPQIPVPIFGINIAKMVGWKGKTIEFQEIIPGIRASPLPWFIPLIEQIPLLPGIIIRDEEGHIAQEGMRLPTVPRSLVGLPVIPIPEPLAKPDFGYDRGEEAELGYRTDAWLLGGRSRGYPLIQGI